MEIVLIDKFIVPEGSKARFLEEVHQSATFLRALPGFVEGFIYEKTDGESRNNIVSTAVWKDDEAFQNAKKSAAERSIADRRTNWSAKIGRSLDSGPHGCFEAYWTLIAKR